MNPRVYILHYADTNKHVDIGLSNLFLNDLALRCVSAIHEFADVKHDLVIVDNGSPPEAHEHMSKLLREHGFEEETIWVKDKWHPPATGQVAAIKDFLASDSEQMAFFSSDSKIGPKTLSCGFKMMEEALTPFHFAAPNMTHYGIGDVENYPSKEAWKLILKSPYLETYTTETAIEYYELHGVGYVIDSWGEPAPISRDSQLGGPWNQIGSIFFANRFAVDFAGPPDTRYIWNDQYQFYDQAKEEGCKFSHMGQIYLPHLGALYRRGVGSYAQNQIKKHAPDTEHHNYALDRAKEAPTAR
ncbi:hypothetical protein ES702_03319 [subsurface metagenome]